MYKLLVILVLVFGVAAGGYYVLQGTSSVPEPITEVEDHEYHSAQYGLSFLYPNTYAMTEHDAGNGERMTHSILLVDKKFQAVQNSEGPPVVAVTIFENIEHLSLEDWVTSTSYSNYKLATNETLHPTSVGGKEALSYAHSGLYETDAVVVMHNGRVYMFTAGWLTVQDQTRSDLEEILSSVEFVAS